jgi:hypothetical protein
MLLRAQTWRFAVDAFDGCDVLGQRHGRRNGVDGGVGAYGLSLSLGEEVVECGDVLLTTMLNAIMIIIVVGGWMIKRQ